MKGASKVFYIIGMITNSILILLLLGLLIFSSICIGDSSILWDIAKTEPDPEAAFLLLSGVMVFLLVLSIVMIILESVILIIVVKAIKSLNDKDKPSTSHVLILVLAILGVNIPLLLGSIFGLVHKSQVDFDDDDDDDDYNAVDVSNDDSDGGDSD